MNDLERIREAFEAAGIPTDLDTDETLLLNNRRERHAGDLGVRVGETVEEYARDLWGDRELPDGPTPYSLLWVLDGAVSEAWVFGGDGRYLGRMAADEAFYPREGGPIPARGGW